MMKFGKEKKKTLAKFYFDIAKIIIGLVILKPIMDNSVNIKTLTIGVLAFIILFTLGLLMEED